VSFTGADSHKHFPLIGVQASSAYTIRSHVQQALQGEISPHRRSLPPPKTPPAAGSVIEVVGSTFDNQVLDKAYDVLLEIYAPWCQHCQAFAPQYTKAARALRFVKTLRVARFDGTQNDAAPELANAFAVDGYPAFRLIKAVTNEVVHYDGERIPRAIIQWVQEHATHTFSFEPTEVNFLASMEGLAGLEESVRKVFRQNRELRLEVQRLKAEVDKAKREAEEHVPTEAEIDTEVKHKAKVGVEVRRLRQEQVAEQQHKDDEAAQEYREGEEREEKLEKRNAEAIRHEEEAEANGRTDL